MMRVTLIVHQVTIEEYLEQNSTASPPRRCRIDFCARLLRRGGEWCEGGHFQYELPAGAKAPVFPGAIDGRGDV